LSNILANILAKILAKILDITYMIIVVGLTIAEKADIT